MCNCSMAPAFRFRRAPAGRQHRRIPQHVYASGCASARAAAAMLTRSPARSMAGVSTSPVSLRHSRARRDSRDWIASSWACCGCRAREAYGLIFVKTQVSDEPIDVDAVLGSLAADAGAARPGLAGAGQAGALAYPWQLEIRARYVRRGLPFRRPASGHARHFALQQCRHLQYVPRDFHFRSRVFPQKIYGKLKLVPESGYRPEIEKRGLCPLPEYRDGDRLAAAGIDGRAAGSCRIFPDGIGSTRVDLAVYAPKTRQSPSRPGRCSRARTRSPRISCRTRTT